MPSGRCLKHLHPKPYTLNPKPYTQNPPPKTLSPKTCKPYTKTLNPGFRPFLLCRAVGYSVKKYKHSESYGLGFRGLGLRVLSTNNYGTGILPDPWEALESKAPKKFVFGGTQSTKEYFIASP